MKKRSFLILSLSVLLFASCGKQGGKSGLLVPKDAAFVMHINTSSLSSKISWEEIKQTTWFKQMRSHNEPDSFAQKLWDDPASSGIDTKEDFVMFVKKHGNGSYMVLEGSLTSQSAYEQFLAQMAKKEPKEIKKTGEFSYITDERSVVLWNKSRFAMVKNADLPATMPGVGGVMGNRRMSDWEGAKFEADSLVIFGQQALMLEGGSNLDSDNRFADLVKDGSDMHAWINAEHFYQGIDPLKKEIPMANTEPLFKGNITTLSLNFENGKIAAKSKHYYGEELSKIMSKNKPQPVTAAMINRIPSSNVVAVFAYNYSPVNLKEILRLVGLDSYADIFLSKVGFSIDEFVKANKGEVLLAVSDPASKATDTSKGGGRGILPFSKADANILFATSVNDTASFQKMLDLATNMLGGLKQKFGGPSGDTEGAPIVPGINYKIANNWFAISNSTQHRDQFLAGANSNIAFADKITGDPVGIYIDLQKINSWIRSSVSRNDGVNIEPSIWQDVVAKGGDFSGNSSEFNIEVNFVDKNTNSLKQLNQWADRQAIKSKERKQRWNDMPVPAPDSSRY